MVILNTNVEKRTASQHPVTVYLASLAPGSQPTALGSLNRIAALLTGDDAAQAEAMPWGALRFEHVAALRARLKDLYAPAQANKLLSFLRSVLKTAHQLGQMSTDDYLKVAGFKRVKGETLPRGRALAGAEMSALLRACATDNTAAGRRDAALIGLLWSVGLRRAEVCELTLADYDMSAQALVVRGKGHKERSVPVESSVATVLAIWLAERGHQAGAMFCPVRKGGKVAVRHMHPEAVFNLLRKRAKAAGVSGISPHDLRRTFVSDMLDTGADIVTVQKIAGHSNVTTTARYDRRGEVVKHEAVELRKLPGVVN